VHITHPHEVSKASPKAVCLAVLSPAVTSDASGQVLLVRIPPGQSFSVPAGLELVALPLYDIHGNTGQFGPRECMRGCICGMVCVVRSFSVGAPPPADLCPAVIAGLPAALSVFDISCKPKPEPEQPAAE
jgi:hypothetical protein